jgi:type IV pilus assembly protein PilW
MRPTDKQPAGAQLKGAARADLPSIMHGHNKSVGFTIVELLISMMVGLLILFAVYETFTVHNRQFKTQELSVEMLQNARVGLDFIVRELRMAGYNPADTLNLCTGTNTAANSPCVGITSIAANSISFTADLNGNGNLTADDTNPDENITYDINNSVMRRTSNGTLQPVVMNISALSFTYYDGSNQTTTDLALIRKIRISITAQATAPGVNNAYQSITVSSDIVPKALAY